MLPQPVCPPARIPCESLQLLLAARVAEDYLMPCTGEERPELAAHQPGTQNTDSHIFLSVSLGFKGSHVNREAILHIGLEHSFVGFVDFLDRNDFDICSDVVFTAEIEHFLGLRQTANV